MKRFVHRHFYGTIKLGVVIALITSSILLVCTSFREVSPWEKATAVKLVKYYPNPAISYINFEFPQEIDKSYTLIIYSFVGRKMTELSVENNKIIVPLTGYYRGLYVFQLKDKTGKIIETGRFQVVQ
jgi:hypothetical protein